MLRCDQLERRFRRLVSMTVRRLFTRLRLAEVEECSKKKATSARRLPGINIVRQALSKDSVFMTERDLDGELHSIKGFS